MHLDHWHYTFAANQNHVSKISQWTNRLHYRTTPQQPYVLKKQNKTKLLDIKQNFKMILNLPKMNPRLSCLHHIWDLLHIVGFCFLSAWATSVKQTGVTTQQQLIQTLCSRPLNSETNQTWCCSLSWRWGRARVKGACQITGLDDGDGR